MAEIGSRSSTFRVVLLNVMTLCTLLVVLNLGAVVFYKGSKSLLAWLNLDADPRAELVNYNGEPWAAQHFAELKKLQQEYHSYIAWRRLPFKGQTINIDPEGQRISVSAETASVDAYFFGGSVVWGTGARDAETIPSYLAGFVPALRVANWGETGFTAHQSLEMLMKLHSTGERPPVVLFMDGVNDVAFKCRRGHGWFTHGLEEDFRRRINTHSAPSLGQLIAPISLVIEKLWQRVRADSKTDYDCTADPRKARAVAQALVDDWRVAQRLVESWGGRFWGFLQPVAYLSDSAIDHLELEPSLGAQYQAVYPLVHELLANEPRMFDITSAVDGDDPVYLDFCHLSPIGNRKVAVAVEHILNGTASEDSVSN